MVEGIECKNKILQILFILAGFLSSAGTVLKIPVGETGFAFVNVIYILIILYQFFEAKKAYKSKTCSIIIALFLASMVSLIIAVLSEYNYISRAFSLLLKNYFILIGFAALFQKRTMKHYLQFFLKGFWLCAFIQMIWSWFERICYSTFNFSLNQYVFENLLHINSDHTFLFLADNGVIRVSGFSWEPANLALVLVIGLILSEKEIHKWLFIISILMTTSMTGFTLLGIYVVAILVSKNKEKTTRKRFEYIGITLFTALIVLALLVNFNQKVNAIFTTYTSRITYLLNYKPDLNNSASVHITYYPEAFKILFNGNVANILFGYGPFLAGESFDTVLSAKYSSVHNAFWNPESDFVTVLVGNGITGIIIFYMLFCLGLKKTYKAKNNKEFYIVLVILFGGITYLYYASTWPLLIVVMICLSNEDDRNRIKNIYYHSKL